MRKKPHGRILREEPKEQHLNTVPKFCPFILFYIFGRDLEKIEISK